MGQVISVSQDSNRYYNVISKPFKGIDGATLNPATNCVRY